MLLPNDLCCSLRVNVAAKREFFSKRRKSDKTGDITV
jgi:hypothetical protein